MPKTQVLCPQCKQPIVVDIQRLFDVGQQPEAKQLILSGMFNWVECPHCGYQGPYPTPIVYHDPDKELLLVYVPPELGLSQDEQEKIVGPLIEQAIRQLPQEKRKAYLLNPQQVLSLRSLQERILEADGITKEMIEAEEKRVKLLQRLLTAPESELVNILKAEDESIDSTFFQTLSQLIDAALAGEDQASAQRLRRVLELALEHTTEGQRQREVVDELKALDQLLARLGPHVPPDTLRRELLNWLLEKPTDSRLQALVTLLRPALDYAFFQAFTERINQIPDEAERERLTQVRERLLALTQAVDQLAQQYEQQVRQLIHSLTHQEDIDRAVQGILPVVDEGFLQILQDEMERARQRGQVTYGQKLQQVWDAIQKALAPPPEVQFLEQLLATPDPKARRQLMEQHLDLVTPEMVNYIARLRAQAEQGGPLAPYKELLQQVYNELAHFMTTRNLRGSNGDGRA
ncbi:MAG: hypothetical protein GXO36_07465 [Chloroflexi bacterium]|nr:hypothetical protein [Chloroflexota bacterium]